MKIKERTFLIVDDEPDVFWAMENLLKQEGLVLIRALNGLEALMIMPKKSPQFKGKAEFVPSD